jgi:hypothetical protein
MTPQPVHSGLVRDARACTRLIKSGYERFVCQQIAILPIFGNRPKLVSDIKYTHKFVTFKVFE